MGPGDQIRPDSRRPLDGDETDRLLDDVRVALTVILGCAQLLQRRLQRGDASDIPALLEHLATIERSIRAVDGRLRQVERDRGDGKARRTPTG